MSQTDSTATYYRRIRWVWIGLALQPIAILIIGSFNELDAMSGRSIVGTALLLISFLLVNWGLWNYAKFKGYGNWVAALSIFNFYSLLIFVFLPNKTQKR